MNSESKNLPVLAFRILQHILPHKDAPYLNKNFEDLYLKTMATRGKFRAHWWIWREILRSLPGFISSALYWRFYMIKNQLTITLRNIRKHKLYSFINISGLALGMTVCILILIWVRNEWSYDRFHENINRLYRVNNVEETTGGKRLYLPSVPIALGPVLESDYPDIIRAARVYIIPQRLGMGEKNFVEDILFTDAAFFEMFSFPLISGTPDRVIADPFSIVLTQSAAHRHFGDENPVGKTFKINPKVEIKVTGVMADLPGNSSLEFDAICPIKVFKSYGADMDDWKMFAYHTYVQLGEKADFDEVTGKISNIIKEHNPKAVETLVLEPAARIHLFNLNGGGRIIYVLIFSLMAVVVLLIACINYMNLSTARSSQRAREVGIRQMVGAHRLHLMKQFFGESIFLASLAVLFSLLLVRLALPVFNNLLGLTLPLAVSWDLMGFIGGIVLLSGLISGCYPAVILSSIKPVQVLKGGHKGRASGFRFRRILVVIQFSLSIFMIIGSLGIYRQLQLIRSRDLGFSAKNIVCMGLDGSLYHKYQVFKDALLKNPSIISLTRTNATPERKQASFTGAMVRWDGMVEGQQVDTFHLMGVDCDFPKTYQLKMAQGEFFSLERKSQLETGIVVNQAAVKAMGMADPIGKKLFFGENNPITIIGVIQDFHYRTLHYEIEPLAVVYGFSWARISIRIAAQNIPETLKFIENTLKNILPGSNFEYEFFDARLKREYSAEQTMQSMIVYATGLTIFIACLGLFGLASFTAEQRTKEIGIRKVLGASSMQMVKLLSGEFTKWVMISNLIAWPLSYYALNSWLQNFAYRTSIRPLLFIGAAVLALLISLLTVGFQALKAAGAHPVQSLRYE